MLPTPGRCLSFRQSRVPSLEWESHTIGPASFVGLVTDVPLRVTDDEGGLNVLGLEVCIRRNDLSYVSGLR